MRFYLTVLAVILAATTAHAQCTGTYGGWYPRPQRFDLRFQVDFRGGWNGPRSVPWNGYPSPFVSEFSSYGCRNGYFPPSFSPLPETFGSPFGYPSPSQQYGSQFSAFPAAYSGGRTPY